jgi:hypothetical protein
MQEWWGEVSIRETADIKMRTEGKGLGREPEGFTAKRLQNLAQGFNPGLVVSARCALKASPTSRSRGAIPNWRSTPTLQYSITPRDRIRGRGRERSAPRVPPEWYSVRVSCRVKELAASLEIWCPCRARRSQNLHPGLKPWAKFCNCFAVKPGIPRRKSFCESFNPGLGGSAAK